MYSNVPESLDLEIRQASDFGELLITVEGVDLSTCNVAAGVSGQTLAPSVRVVDAETLAVTFSSSLTAAMRASQSPNSSQGHHRWWLDLISKADGLCEPLLMGRVSIVEKGFQGA